MEILYVDDDTEDIQFFLEALYNIDRSIKFCYALNANDALKKLNNYLFKPDAIFVDCQLGGMDGFECVKHIRAREELKNIPVIVLSGKISSNTVDEFNKLGVYHFLAKTGSLSVMQRALKVLLENIRKPENDPV